MNKLFRARHRLAAGTAVTSAAVVLATVNIAQAAPAQSESERFLDAEEMPPHETSDWYASEPRQGLPEEPVFCLDQALPEDGDSQHRLFSTDVDTGGLQVIHAAASGAEAEQLAAELAAATADCAADWLRQNPGSTAAWDDYGTVEGGDGARVFGVHTAPPASGQNLVMYGIGRDGAEVTVVGWSQMGTLEEAPVAEFTNTVATALEKLAD